MHTSAHTQVPEANEARALIRSVRTLSRCFKQVPPPPDDLDGLGLDELREVFYAYARMAPSLGRTVLQAQGRRLLAAENARRTNERNRDG